MSFLASQIRSCRPMFVDGQVQFTVWAPYIAQVRLGISTSGQPLRWLSMEKDSEGYHRVTCPDARPGDRYGYSLNNGPLRPDPNSVWQPDGVHHRSALFDPHAMQWTDQDWRGVAREDLVFYELHVGTFTEEGTFDAVIPRLQSLKELGITAIEIMPISQFPGTRNWGYDGVHLFAAQNSYGGPAGLQRLVDAAHREGLAVFLDLVYNHLGPEGNYIGEFGPYYSDRYGTPWGKAFNFDSYDSDPVRDLILDNVWHWFHDFHIDGMRLDAVHAMFDISPRHILADIKEIADAAAAVHQRPATIVVESLLNDVRMVLPHDRGGYGLDAEWNEDFHHALVGFFTGETHGKYADFGAVTQLAKVLEDTFFLNGIYSRFRRRRWGTRVGDVVGSQFVIGVQNHDHVGNRALGERISVLVAPAVERLGASMMLFAPHLPLIFMGEEYSERNPFLFFCSFEDERLVKSVRSGRKRDYGLSGRIPDPQAESSFIESKLSWQWPEGSHQAGVRRLYQDLLVARRTWPALKDWRYRRVMIHPDAEHPQWLEYHRGESAERSPLAILYNLTERPLALSKSHYAHQPWLFSSADPKYLANSDTLDHPDAETLLPFECRVYPRLS